MKTKTFLFFIFTILIFFNSKAQNFGIYESAIYLDSGSGNAFYNTLGTTIGALNVSDLSTVSASQGLIMNGAEVKTFKNSGYNVCGAKVYFVVYPLGQRPASPLFGETDLPFYENCSEGAFQITGGMCSDGDQKWQRPGNSTILNINLFDGFVDGNYTLEVFYQITGDSGTGMCDQVAYDSNGGLNYTTNIAYSSTMAVEDNTLQTIFFTLNTDKTKLIIKGMEDKGNSNFYLFDTQGKIVKQGILINSQIDLNTMPRGIYFVQLKTKDGKNYVHKFIK